MNLIPKKYDENLERLSYTQTLGIKNPGSVLRKKTIENYRYNYNQFLQLEKNMRILDIGCGSGIALEWLAGNGFQNLFGVDQDLSAIKIAREKLNGRVPEKNIICDNFIDYIKSQENESFDVVVMFNVIEHLEKSTFITIVKEIQRILRFSGVFIAQTGNFENPFNLGLFARDFTHEILFTRHSLHQALSLCGFKRESTVVRPVKYRTTWKNWPLQISSTLCGWILQGFALSMRMQIRETAKMIYSVTRSDKK